MPILRTFARAALVLGVGCMVVSGIMVDVSTFLPSTIIAVTLRGDGENYMGLVDADKATLYLFPITIPNRYTSWSPNGRYVIGYGEKDNVFDTRNGTLTELPEELRCGNWSPDNYHIACREESTDQIFIINRDMSHRYIINDSIGATSVAWSPDGRQLAYSAYDGTSTWIYIHNVSTETSYLIAKVERETSIRDWSPDSQYLIGRVHEMERWESYLLNTENGTILSINDDLGLNLNRVGEVVWSPDGDRFVFQAVTHIDSAFNYGPLLVTDLSGLGTWQIAENGIRPQWSPDGTQVAFESPEPINSQSWKLNLYIVNSDGSNPRLITNSGWYATWSDDGKSVFFASDGLSIVNQEGNMIRRLLYLPDHQIEYMIHFALWR